VRVVGLEPTLPMEWAFKTRVCVRGIHRNILVPPARSPAARRSSSLLLRHLKPQREDEQTINTDGGAIRREAKNWCPRPDLNQHAREGNRF